jgi:hypothetical protein
MTAVTLTVMPPTATSMTEPVVLYKPYIQPDRVEVIKSKITSLSKSIFFIY